MKTEVWKDINGYEGRYKVSNLGNIKSVSRPSVYRPGVMVGGRNMRPVDRKGYIVCTLSDGVQSKIYQIERIVAEAFCANPNKHNQIRHKDGNYKNNCADNLEWVGIADNCFCDEEWRDIPGYEGYYQASTYGRVRSLSNKAIKLNGGIIRPQINKNGRVKISLQKHFPDGTYKRTPNWLPRIIAKTFLPNPNGLPEVNHINENPTDNRVCNLEWCTSEYNIKFGTGRQRARASIQIPVCSIDENGVLRIYHSIDYASKETKCDASAISKVCRGVQKHTHGLYWHYYDRNLGYEPNQYGRHNELAKRRYHYT